MPGSLPICVNRPVEARPINCCELKSTRLTRDVSKPPGHIGPVDEAPQFLGAVRAHVPIPRVAGDVSALSRAGACRLLAMSRESDWSRLAQSLTHGPHGPAVPAFLNAFAQLGADVCRAAHSRPR